MAARIALRPGREEEATALSELALRSKGYWGYDESFLEACRRELTIPAGEVVVRRVVVAETEGRVVGLYSLGGEPPVGELGLLFVEPELIGQGIGRSLFDHMSATARALGFTVVWIEADPGAAPFYEAMGARVVGSVPSGSIEGRSLPLLEYDPTTGSRLRQS